MSHRALQCALVIALHDAAFAFDLRRDPDHALDGFDLTLSERAQLLSVDPRAYATDPLRPRRVLRTLVEEMKVSSTLALWETRSAAFAQSFFNSRFFRGAVLERTPLVLAYGAYLAAARLATTQLPDIIRLELLLARSRRPAPTAPGIGLAPGVASGAFDASVMETVQVVEKFLFEMSLVPQLAFCEDGPALPALPSVGLGTVHLLVTPTGLTHIDEALHRVLAALATPVPRDALARTLSPAGVPSNRAAALVASLIDDGLVVE